MAESLKVKVSLMLDARETANDLDNMIKALSVPPLTVDLKIGKIQNLDELNAIDFTHIKREFRDIFDIDQSIIGDIKDVGRILENVVNAKINSKTLESFREMSQVLGNIGKSFEVDNNVVSKFGKMNDMLKEFNSLSKDAQKVLLSQNQITNKNSNEGQIKDVKQNLEKNLAAFNESLDRENRILESSMEKIGDSQIKSMTRYLNATDGLHSVVVKKLNSWTNLTEQSYGDGTKLGKLTVDVEGHMKKLEKAYEGTVKNIRKYSVDLHKALDVGDVDAATGLKMILDQFESVKKKMVKDVMDSPFAEDLMSKFFNIDLINGHLKNMSIDSYDKGVNEKEVNQKINDYIKEYEGAVKKLESLNKELRNAQANGLGDYAEDLTKEIADAKQKLSGLLNVEPLMLFPDDKDIRKDMRKRAKEISDAMEEMSKLSQSKFDNIQKNKLENSGLSSFLSSFKSNVNEIESLEKKLANAINGGQHDYASSLQSKIDSLKEEQDALKETAKSLASYEKAMQSVQAVEEKSKKNIDLHNAYLDNKNKNQQEVEVAKQQERKFRESELARQRQLKAQKEAEKSYWKDMLKHQDDISKGYEQVTKTLTSKQNEYIQAIADDNLSKADGLKKTVEFWNDKKKELLETINKNSFTSDFYDKINEIDKKNNLFVGEFEGSLNDKINTKIANDNKRKEKELINAYAKMSKTLADKENKLLQAVMKDDLNQVKAFENSVKKYEEDINQFLSKIDFSSFSSNLREEFAKINLDNGIIQDEFVAKLDDSLRKELLKKSNMGGDLKKDLLNQYKQISDLVTSKEISLMKSQANGTENYSKSLKATLEVLQDRYKKVVDSIKNNGFSDALKEQMSEIDKLNKLKKDETSGGIKDKSIKDKNKEEKDSIDDLVKRYKELYREREKFEKALSTAVPDDMFKSIGSDIESLSREIDGIYLKLMKTGNSSLVESFVDDKALAQSRELSRAIEKVRSEANQLLVEVKELETSEWVDQQSLLTLKTTLGSLSNSPLEGTVKDIRQMNVELAESNNLLNQLNNQHQSASWDMSKKLKLDEINQSIDKFKNDFKHVLDGKSFDVLDESARRLSQTMNKDSFSHGAKELTSQLKRARAEMDNLSVASRDYNFFEDLYTNMRTYQLGDLIVDGIQEAMYSVKQIVVDMDTAMANVKKVASPVDVNTVDKLDEIKFKAIEISKEVGMASSDVINSIADTVQSGGYRMEEAIEIARQTMMLANVGEMSSEMATEGVVSMLAGFDLQPLREVQVEVDGMKQKTNELTNAMDMVNHVGNNFAISTEGIITAMQSGATVLHAYGVSMEDTVALITGANRTLQDPSVIGNGLKSIAINLAGIKADAYSGELALNKTALTLKEVAKINIFEDEQQTQVKDMMTILDELHGKWDTFTEKEQLGLAEAIAGKQQSKVFQSLMTNFKDVIAVRDEFAQGNHFGSAEAEK